MDNEFLEGKLKGWSRIDSQDIQKGQHIRCTSNNYRMPGRKCAHLVVQEIDDECNIYVNSYGDQKYPNWTLKNQCQFKQERYYIRSEPDKEHDGICIKCRDAEVSHPYWICTYCRYNTASKPKN